MTINLRQVIEGEGIAPGEGFAGAVLLTFTLNLNFYEQIVAQSLERAGCSNVLIIADPDGYAGAMEMGAKSISGAGMRYVCTPISRKGSGVQHVKLLFMAGPKRARLLVGSGNLTMHGYGRNLELFSQFEYDSNNPADESQYALVEVWKLISQLDQDGQLPPTAHDQLDTIRDKATWLSSEIPNTPDFRIWHNYSQSIWQQLQEWRQARGLTKPLHSLQVISPYFDQDARTLVQVSDALNPHGVNVYVDPASTNLDGPRLGSVWTNQPQNLSLNSLVATVQKRSRPLHAKAIIGVENEGSWCISGSANLSQPGLTKSWLTGGNLEMVTFRWQSDQRAFAYLLEDEAIHISTVSVDEIIGESSDPSERTVRVDAEASLTNLVVRGKVLEGQASVLPPSWGRGGQIQLLRSGQEFPVLIGSSGNFRIDLRDPLQEAEAARLVLGGKSTPYRWIDQPEALARFGARAYHAQIRAKMETIGGAEKLFQDLMNFLWDRFDPQKITEEAGQVRLARKARYGKDKEPDKNAPPPPPAEKFITNERLLEQISWGIEQQKPYDRSNWSLRDLISLALLRLTTSTQPPEVLTEAGTIDEEAEQQNTAQQEQERVDALDNIRTYVLRYCKRYGERLSDEGFLEATSPQVLFANHFTLGRILLELADKVDSFTQKDLKICFWRVWAPLVWPSIVGNQNLACLTLLKQKNSAESIAQAWRDNGLPSLTVKIMVRAFGAPYGSVSTGDLQWVQGYMAARELISRMQMVLVTGAFEINNEDLGDAEGIKSLSELLTQPQDMQADELKVLKETFNAISEYVPPTERRYGRLRELQILERAGQGQSPQANEIVQWFTENGLDKYLEFRHIRLPVLPVKWGAPYCPKCFIELTSQKLNHLKDGDLVMCSASKDALIYWVPQLPKSVV